ncbi:NAD-binding protein [Phellopilus nigrolimitatus]|nr:NAD-binding protein [Phellopilus nigrolimitatus]
MVNVLLLGATGYIGGSLLVSLKKAYSEVVITALVRSESDFPAIRAAGAAPVRGSFSDHDPIADLSASADIVVNAADSDDVALASAILRGLRRRKEEGRGVGAFIQTSGGAVFMDDRMDGKYDPNLKIWTDTEEDIRSLTTKMPHAQVDIPIMKASEEGHVNSFIICPPIVFGRGSGPVKRESVFFKLVLAGANILERKEMVYIGEGSNVNGAVHIDDLVEAYHLIFKLALATGPGLLASSPYSRYYVAGSIRVDWKTLATIFATELHKRGLIKSPVPVSVSYEDAGSFNWYMAKNTAMRNGRILELGWTPKHADFSEDTFAHDVDAALKEMNASTVS